MSVKFNSTTTSESRMKTTDLSIFLQSKLEDLIQAVHGGKAFTCLGKTKKDKRCSNPLKKTTLKSLTLLIKNIMTLLEMSDEEVDTLLEAVSSLCMCKVHQNQTIPELMEMSKRISTERLDLAYSGDDIKNLTPTPAITHLRDPDAVELPSQEKKVEPTNLMDNQPPNQDLAPIIVQLSSITDFCDSGFQYCGADDPFFTPDLDSIVARTVVSSSTPGNTSPETPQKATKLASTDSAISMSFDTNDQTETNKSTKYMDGSESPLAYKGARSKRTKAESKASRPAPTPIQPTTLPIRTKTQMVPFEEPFTKMKTYIRTPFKLESDKKKGYIYGFQIEGCPYTKVGCVGERGTQPSLEAAFDKRMKELTLCWPGHKLVLRKLVPHAQRVEKIIHYHLEAGRMKQKCLCKGQNKKILEYRTHMEWFNISLDEIYTVVFAWKHWMESIPYVKQYDMYHLDLQWESRLENVLNHNGRDNWKDWLCVHMPDLPKLIEEDGSSNRIESESTAEIHGSFLRNSVKGSRFEIRKASTFSF